MTRVAVVLAVLLLLGLTNTSQADGVLFPTGTITVSGLYARFSNSMLGSCKVDRFRSTESTAPLISADVDDYSKAVFSLAGGLLSPGKDYASAYTDWPIYEGWWLYRINFHAQATYSWKPWYRTYPRLEIWHITDSYNYADGTWTTDTGLLWSGDLQPDSYQQIDLPCSIVGSTKLMFRVTPVPEPSSLLAVLCGIGYLANPRWRKRS